MKKIINDHKDLSISLLSASAMVIGTYLQSIGTDTTVNITLNSINFLLYTTHMKFG